MSLPSTLSDKDAPSERGADSLCKVRLLGGWPQSVISRLGSLNCLPLSLRPAFPSSLLHERMLVGCCSPQPHTAPCHISSPSGKVGSSGCVSHLRWGGEWTHLSVLYTGDLWQTGRQADRQSRSFFVVTFKQQPQLPSAPWLGSLSGEVLRVSSPRPRGCP